MRLIAAVCTMFLGGVLSGTASLAQSQLVIPITPVPEQATASEGMADVGDAKIWYWDTGGTGPAVILLHAGVGSGAFWPYQQPVLAKAGYRVVSYSRRGHFKSETGPKDNLGTAAGDIVKLMDHLRIDKAHIVGTAAGGIYATDLALTNPGRVRSLIIACSLVTVDDAAYMKESGALRPKGFTEMAPEFRELGPAYRAGHPEGTAHWIRLEKEAVHTAIRQPLNQKLTLEALEKITQPVLMMTGDADLYTPPPMLKKMVDRLKTKEVLIIDGAGHSAHWEQPAVFNKAVLDFLAKQPK